MEQVRANYAHYVDSQVKVSTVMTEIRAVSDINGAYQLTFNATATAASLPTRTTWSLATHPDELRIWNQLRAYGVNEDHILALIFMFLGWHEH
uniref:Uncharacterized protein n=1 Tax=Anopheles dirus TaxID=7168 RepID=A0A182NHZ1_9DIPT